MGNIYHNEEQKHRRAAADLDGDVKDSTSSLGPRATRPPAIHHAPRWKKPALLALPRSFAGGAPAVPVKRLTLQTQLLRFGIRGNRQFTSGNLE